MTHTEKLVAALRQIETDIRVYANAIPEREGRNIRRAVVFIEVDSEPVINFSGSIRSTTTFRVQFRADRYEEADEMSRKFASIAGRQMPPFTLGGSFTEYDDKLSLQVRETVGYGAVIMARNKWDATINEADFNRLIKKLDNLPVEVARTIRGAATFAAAKVVATEAKATTAFQDRTGRLRRSIRARRGKGYAETLNGKRVQLPAVYAATVVGGTGARQGVLIEYGTVKMRARPFLEPAARSSTSRAFHAARLAAQREFKKLGKK